METSAASRTELQLRLYGVVSSELLAHAAGDRAYRSDERLHTCVARAHDATASVVRCARNALGAVHCVWQSGVHTLSTLRNKPPACTTHSAVLSVVHCAMDALRAEQRCVIGSAAPRVGGHVRIPLRLVERGVHDGQRAAQPGAPAIKRDSKRSSGPIKRPSIEGGPRGSSAGRTS